MRGMGKRADNVKCTCENRENWYLDMIEFRGMQAWGKTLWGWVRCRKCGGNWCTKAKYIRDLPNSDKPSYKEAFRKEDTQILEWLRRRNERIPEELHELEKARDTLIKEMNGNKEKIKELEDHLNVE